jgi:hypothetical protein
MIANADTALSSDRKKVLCIYLGLKTLDVDNAECFRNGQTSCFTNFAQAVSLAQKWILDCWIFTAPEILTKLDTWVKRKQSLLQPIFRRGDVESILKWNLCVLYQLLVNVGSDTLLRNIRIAIQKIVQDLLRELENLPENYFCSHLWSSMNWSSVPTQDQQYIKNFLSVSLVFQVAFTFANEVTIV